jgi:hypothetical protein
MAITPTILIKEVVGRIGTYIGGAEKGLVKPANLRKMMKFNHLNLHVVAPDHCRKYLMTCKTLAVKGSGGNVYLDLNDVTDNHIKDIWSITYTGADVASMSPYEKALGAEHLFGVAKYDEAEEEGRYWLPNRGDGRIRLLQGTSVSSLEKSLDLWYIREFRVDYSNVGIEFDCPTELVEIFCMSVSKDGMLETGNKQGAESMMNAIQAQQALITGVTQLDQMKGQTSTALDNANRDS